MNHRQIAIVVLSALGLCAWYFRYDVISVGNNAAQMVDRLEGSVYFLRGMNQPTLILTNSPYVPIAIVTATFFLIFILRDTPKKIESSITETPPISDQVSIINYDALHERIAVVADDYPELGEIFNLIEDHLMLIDVVKLNHPKAVMANASIASTNMTKAPETSIAETVLESAREPEIGPSGELGATAHGTALGSAFAAVFAIVVGVLGVLMVVFIGLLVSSFF